MLISNIDRSTNHAIFEEHSTLSRMPDNVSTDPQTILGKKFVKSYFWSRELIHLIECSWLSEITSALTSLGAIRRRFKAHAVD